jgi:NAD(P)-dependent dehydrogenase (short-subunit alcohol dehydrogenase family)
MKTIVITGSSSGIGKATAKYFARQGWKVAATMRKPENETELNRLENISLYTLDVTDAASIVRAAEQILSDFGRVDVVLNNAGYAVLGAFEAATPEQIQRQFATNLFGLMSVTRAFLPHFRANRAGLFLNVSSIGGRVTFPFLSLYHSTKWAVEGFSESLAYELKELGIQVKIIEPGGVDTDFAGRSMSFAAEEGLTAYDALMSKFQANSGNTGLAANTAQFLAEGIYQAATDGKSQLRYLIGPDAEQVYGLRQQIGDDAFVAGIRQQMLP